MLVGLSLLFHSQCASRKKHKVLSICFHIKCISTHIYIYFYIHIIRATVWKSFTNINDTFILTKWLKKFVIIIFDLRYTDGWMINFCNTKKCRKDDTAHSLRRLNMVELIRKVYCWIMWNVCQINDWHVNLIKERKSLWKPNKNWLIAWSLLRIIGLGWRLYYTSNISLWMLKSMAFKDD